MEQLSTGRTGSEHAVAPVDPRAAGGSIVVGVDGSEHAGLALTWAADEADRRGAFLRILCADLDDHEHAPGWYVSGASPQTPARSCIDEMVGQVAARHPSVLARGEVVHWPAAMMLTSASRSADLLAVGARGLGGFDELLLGSVSDQCIQYAHCPVVVVRDPDDATATSVPPRIVVGVDGSDGSTRALRWALDEAQTRSASVEAVFAWQYPPIHAIVAGPTQAYEVVAREIEEATIVEATRQAPAVPFTVTSCFRAAVPALLDASKGADVLVVGSQGHRGFVDALLGSTAHQCARHASCPVVVARPPVPT